MNIEKSETEKWLTAVTDKIGDLDQGFRDFSRTRPVVAALCAVGSGFAVSLLAERLQPAKQRDPAKTEAASPSRLGELVRSQVNEVSAQYKGPPEGGVPAIALNVGKFVEAHLSRFPYEAMAAAFGVGLGLPVLNKKTEKKEEKIMDTRNLNSNWVKFAAIAAGAAGAAYLLWSNRRKLQSLLTDQRIPDAVHAGVAKLKGALPIEKRPEDTLPQPDTSLAH